jgi:type I restriction enzyme S subunit
MGDSSWTTATVADIAATDSRSIAIGPFGSSLKAEVYSRTGIPVVRGQDITDIRSISEVDRVYVPEAVAEQFPACMVRSGDLIFPHRGAIGRVGIIEDQEMLLSSSMMKLTVDRAIMDPLFVFYYFRDVGREELLARASTVGTPGIGQPLKSLRSILIHFPSLSHQRAIARTLGAFDDKIAANEKSLRLADGLIRAKFDRLDGEHIPLSQVALNIRENVDPRGVAPTTPYIGLEHIPRRRMWLSDHSDAREVTSAKSSFKTADVLFGKLRPYFHKVASAAFDGIASTDVLVIRAKRAELAGYVLAATSADDVIRVATAASEGTRMPRTSWADVGAAQIRWPGEAEAGAFSSEVTALACLAAQLARESKSLGEIRDELLPLLMSGKIRVRDAERQVEDAL